MSPVIRVSLLGIVLSSVVDGLRFRKRTGTTPAQVPPSRHGPRRRRGSGCDLAEAAVLEILDRLPIPASVFITNGPLHDDRLVDRLAAQQQERRVRRLDATVRAGALEQPDLRGAERLGVLHAHRALQTTSARRLAVGHGRQSRRAREAQVPHLASA